LQDAEARRDFLHYHAQLNRAIFAEMMQARAASAGFSLRDAGKPVFPRDQH
jgi:hypothetical protein